MLNNVFKIYQLQELRHTRDFTVQLGWGGYSFLNLCDFNRKVTFDFIGHVYLAILLKFTFEPCHRKTFFRNVIWAEPNR